MEKYLEIIDTPLTQKDIDEAINKLKDKKGIRYTPDKFKETVEAKIVKHNPNPSIVILQVNLGPF